jgi:hypothetical protein
VQRIRVKRVTLTPMLCLRKEKMTNKTVFNLALVLMIIHFIITAVIGHFIAVQIGAQMGIRVAHGLIESSEKNVDGTEKDPNSIYENMISSRDSIFKTWRIPRLLISLPAKPVMNPLLKEIGTVQLERVISKDISKDQFYRQGRMIEYTARSLISFSFVILVYAIRAIYNKLRAKHNDRMQPIGQNAASG